MSSFYPYDVLVSRAIVSPIKSRQRREFSVWSGRRLGKSVVAERLALHFSAATDETAVIQVEGRPSETAHERLEREDLSRARFLILDDAEYLFSNVKAKEMLSSFLGRRRYFDPDRPAIIMTSRSMKALVDAAQNDDACSVLVLKCIPVQLDPWKQNWRSALTKAVEQMIGDDKESVREWSYWIAEQTGGHPALIGQALAILELNPSLSVTEANPSIRFQLTERARMLVSTALGDFKVEEPEAFRQLVAAAAAEPGKVPDEALRTGLVYVDESSDFPQSRVVPGLIREVLSRDEVARSGERRRRLILKADDVNRDERGLIQRFEFGSIQQEMSLSGSPWKIARLLYEVDGAVVTREALQRAVFGDCTESAALNSALQRLRNALDEVDLRDALENVRSHGYRLKTSF